MHNLDDVLRRAGLAVVAPSDPDGPGYHTGQRQVSAT